MDDEIKRIDRQLKYRGSILDISTDIMQFPNGNTAEWDYVAHRKGAAAVIPVLKNGNILMVKQYRNAIERYTLEIPAGSKDFKEEPAIDCAARELEEETGYRAGKLEKLITVATTVAFCNEVIDIFLATDLVKTGQHLDENEYLNVYECSLNDLICRILDGTLQDSKTISAIMAYALKCKKYPE